MNGKAVKRGISYILSFLLLFELIPVTAYADEIDADPPYTDEIIVEEYANNTASSEKAEIVEEIETLRDEYQKVFLLESGMTLATIYPFSVHYENNGKWDEIDNTLVLKEEEERSAYHNTVGVWDISLPSALDKEI